MKTISGGVLSLLLLLALSRPAVCQVGPAAQGASDPFYEHADTRDLVRLVNDAADLVRRQGDAAFGELRTPDSRWRRGEMYVFVLDPEGNMLVHPDPALEGKNQLGLQDINGKPIIRGLIAAAASFPSKPEGWYHYEWPVPGGILPRWKSSYVRLAAAPSGKTYVVGSGVYNDRMERVFVVDAVKDAVARIEKDGEAAFALFHDPKGPFIAKDAYVFVYDLKGRNRVLPAFPNLEGRDLLDMKDTEGKPFIREMIRLVQTSGCGWVDYMWPKPGESVPTQKSAYVSKANAGGEPLLVGCGIYLADAPKAARQTPTMTAPALMKLVREAAARLEQYGEKAFAEFRKKGSKWFRDQLYFFVLDMEGTNVFHAAEPAREGQSDRDVTDILGRNFGKMYLEAAHSPSGEGWVHYMYPEPGGLFPAWKSTYVKRVTFPSGTQRFVGSGLYNMQMDKAFIEDVVNRAASLIAQQGTNAFGQLRNKTGPFVFMDTYVFVDTTDGVEVVNAAQPSFEGVNLRDAKDVKGKALVREYIAAAMKDGCAWVDYYWYRPGYNTPRQKQAYVRKVPSGDETYIVGSGLYLE